MMKYASYASTCYALKVSYLNFHPLEVVCRGSETQLQAGENVNKIT